MTAASKKYMALKIFLSALLLLLLCPLYMYFSHDVEKLNTYYPQIQVSDDLVTFELKKERPTYWVSLDKISKYGISAIVLTEDWGFWDHKGIDSNQIKIALREMLESKRFRGASTITQQMVKNVYLSEKKSLWRKIHEFILTQKVEQVMTKKRILEIYLNCIEFGPGVYGIKDASNHYFKKAPSALTPKEAAFLALLLPSPKRYYVSFRKKRLTKFATKRIGEILVKMRMGKVLTPSEYKTQVTARLSWEK